MYLCERRFERKFSSFESLLCFFFVLVISVNNSAAHLQIASSDAGSASECESGDISSDEYPSQIKVKPFTIDHGQENQHDSTHEMGTLAQLLNHSVPTHVDTSISSQKYVEVEKSHINFEYNFHF